MSYKRYSKEFKLRVLREMREKGAGGSVAALARRYGVNRALIYEWAGKLKDGALKDSFEPSLEKQLQQQLGELERKVGQLTMENDFLKKTLERFEQQYPRPSDSSETSCIHRSRQR